MNGIHFLKGSGSNCTCYDCSVLYGGKCYTTPTNNFLDRLEKDVRKYLAFTPTGRPKKVSDHYLDRCIEDVIRVPFMKFAKIDKSLFYKKYYTLLPLIFLMTSDKAEARGMYRRGRQILFTSITDEYKNEQKKV